MKGKYGTVEELGEADEVLLSVPDLQTEAVLVLARRKRPLGAHVATTHVIGWRNWNGLRADGSAKLRWSEGWASEDAAVARFWSVLDQGPRRLKPPKSPDRQPGRFGRWLREAVNPLYADEPEMTLDEVRAFVAGVWREQGKRTFPPMIDAGRGCKSALYYPRDRKLALPKWARRKHTILVSLAHGLVKEERDHGPFYVRKVVELHARYLGRKEFAMIAELKDYKVEVGA